MATPYSIPVTNTAQQFTVSLGNVIYSMTIKWNSNANVWVLDLADQNNNLIAGGIPLVTGTDLFGQLGYLNLGGQLIASTEFDPTAPPTYNNLGTLGTLTFVTEP